MSTFAAAEPVARRLRRLARPSAVRVALLATSLAGAAYAVTLAVRLGSVLTFTYQDSDAASGPVMGEAVGRLGYHDVVLGHIAWYPQLWLYRLTVGLPGRHVLWVAAPLLFALAAAAVTAWTSARLFGRWAGVFVAVTLCCAGPTLLDQYARPIQHLTTVVATALLGGLLVLAVRRRASATVLAAPAAVVAGTCLASDRLVVLAALAPLALAALALVAKRPGRASREVAALAVGVVALAALSALVVGRVAEGAGVAAVPLSVHLATLGDLPRHAWLLVEGVVALGDGDHVRLLIPLILAGAAAPVVAARRVVVHEPRAGAFDGDEAALVWVVYWGASSALVMASFLFSDQAVSLATLRYLVTPIFAAAAVAPYVLRRRPRGPALAVAAAALMAAAGAYALAQGVPEQHTVPTRAEVRQIVAIAQRHGLRYGYGHYWNAANVTWLSGFRVRVAPVGLCKDRLCRFAIHNVGSWYRPRPHTPTFVIVGAGRHGLAGLPRGLGEPAHAWRAGSLTLYAFPYDVAARFGAGTSVDDGVMSFSRPAARPRSARPSSPR